METTVPSSKFLDTIDNIDRYFYGRKMKNFLIGSLIVLVIAPLLDEVLEVPYDRLTWLSTFTFFLYVLIIVLAWISAWRDDKGKWTLKRAMARIETYYYTFRDVTKTTRTSSRDELLYKAGGILFFSAIGWKSLQNLSVFIRKPIKGITGHTMVKFIRFERFTNHWYWLPLILGIGILIYLYRTNPKILDRIKKDLLQLFGRRNPTTISGEITIKAVNEKALVVNAKHSENMQAVFADNSSGLFNDFAVAMKNWNPGKCYYEYEFKEKLFRHLKNTMPNSDIQTEIPLGSAAEGNKGRGDMAIDGTILIEMKRGITGAGDIQRAKGQIIQYPQCWNSRGPLILLLCDHEYEKARLTYASTISELNRPGRSVLAIVQEN